MSSTQIRSKILFAAQRPPHMRVRETSTGKEVLRSQGLNRFRNAIEKGRVIVEKAQKLTESLGAIKEAANAQDAKAWLEKAYLVVSERSDLIENVEEKRAFQELASLLKESIPLPEASDEDVQRGLSILRQRIHVATEDSEQLRTVKKHLLGEIGKIL
jgi:hypothetical protein